MLSARYGKGDEVLPANPDRAGIMGQILFFKNYFSPFLASFERKKQIPI